MKNILLICGLLLTVTAFSGCSDSDSYTVLRNQSGLLIWGGSPVVDGTGMLFQTADTTYGITGNGDNYAQYFAENERTARIRANVVLTGETTIRGWGSRFPEAYLSRIRPE
jgi:hypothetical protein